MLEKAFQLISDKVEEALKQQGFERVGVSNTDSSEMVTLYTSEAIAYSVVYYKRKKHMVLETCDMTDEGPDNDWKTLATWMFDPETDTEKDAQSIANDFVDTIAAPVRKKATKGAKKKKKDEEGNADPLFFSKRLFSVFPELKEEVKAEEDCYDPFRGVTFAKASIVPKVNELLKSGSKQDITKLAAVLNAQYDAGDMDTRSIITIVILNGIETKEQEDALLAELSDTLQKAWGNARRFKGKAVKPEKKKKPKKSFVPTLNQ